MWTFSFKKFSYEATACNIVTFGTSGCVLRSPFVVGARCLWVWPGAAALLGARLMRDTEILAKLFSFGIYSILYQCGIHPSENFTQVQKYGLILLITTDSELMKYLNKCRGTNKNWLYKCSAQKLMVVISNTESSEVLERWPFDIKCDKTAKDDSRPREKSQKAVQVEICLVRRHITATVTFQPLLEVSCLFHLLMCTKTWLHLKSRKSQDHSSLPILSKSACVPSLLQSTK